MSSSSGVGEEELEEEASYYAPLAAVLNTSGRQDCQKSALVNRCSVGVGLARCMCSLALCRALVSTPPCLCMWFCYCRSYEGNGKE